MYQKPKTFEEFSEEIHRSMPDHLRMGPNIYAVINAIAHSQYKLYLELHKLKVESFSETTNAEVDCNLCQQIKCSCG